MPKVKSIPRLNYLWSTKIQQHKPSAFLQAVLQPHDRWTHGRRQKLLGVQTAAKVDDLLGESRTRPSCMNIPLSTHSNRAWSLRPHWCRDGSHPFHYGCNRWRSFGDRRPDPKWSRCFNLVATSSIFGGKATSPRIFATIHFWFRRVHAMMLNHPWSSLILVSHWSSFMPNDI